MKRGLATAAAITILLVVHHATLSRASSYIPNTYALVLGADKAMCAEVLKKIAAIFPVDFVSGGLSEAFARDDWKTTTIDWTGNNGRKVGWNVRYMSFDLDNDGQAEIVIHTPGMIRSTNYDSWDVLSPADFAAAREDGVVGVQYAPERIDADYVELAEANIFLPLTAFMAPWTYEKRNYVIFQSVFFAYSDPEYPNRRARSEYIVVAEYQHRPHPGEGRWKPMKPVCAIRDQK